MNALRPILASGMAVAMGFAVENCAAAAPPDEIHCGHASCATARHSASQQVLLHETAVFSDDPVNIRDPRHPQSQTGEGRLFAPIGLVATNHPVPHQAGATVTMNLDMATAFLVSPCYILTNYHVVFGNRAIRPDAGQDYSMTFHVAGRTARAVPIRYGEFYRFAGRDWALLQLDPDGQHRCVGEDLNIGWLRLMPVSAEDVTSKPLSVAGYPSDKPVSQLWRQDVCQLYEKNSEVDYDGIWTTDCSTVPRSSGSPVFYVENGVLNVVAVMEGHLGSGAENEIEPKWNPERANLAVDVGKILASDPEILRLIDADIERFLQSYKTGESATDAERPTATPAPETTESIAP